MLNQKSLSASVSELMNEEVICLSPLDSMTEVRDIFKENEIHHLPVVDDQKKVVGMISKMDYNRVLSCHMLFNKEKNESYNNQTLKSLLVQDVMTQGVITVDDKDSLLKVAGIFRANLFHALPVVDLTNQLVGIITTFDLLVYAYEQ